MPRAAGSSNYYTIGLMGHDGAPTGHTWHFPSVTSILDDVISKPRLMHWYYSKGVDGVAELAKTQKIPSDPKILRGMLKSNGLSPYAYRDKAASTGTNTHSLFEGLVTGETVERTPDTEGILNWWEDRGLSKADVLAVEEPLVSFKYGYAGTVDLIYKDPQTGRVVLTDLKTGKYVFWTHFVQGEAYRQAWVENGGSPADVVSVLHANPNVKGRGYVEKSCPEITFETFEAALKIYQELPLNWKPDDLDDVGA